MGNFFGGGGKAFPSLTDSGALVTSTSGILLPIGSVTNPSLQWAESTANAGLYRNGANTYEFSIGNSTVMMRWLSALVPVVVRTALGISTDPRTVGPDLILSRRAAANFSLGAADVNGVPVAQTLSVQNAITGSNLPGSVFTIAGPLGTGTGAGAATKLQRGLMQASGTTAQTLSDAFAIGQSKTLSNTSATAQTVATITLGSNAGGGCSGVFTLVATDGTNFDSETQSFVVSYVNKAGAITVGTAAITASTAANNSGSATLGITAVANGNNIDIKVTPVFTTIVPTTVTLFPTISHATGTVTFV